jgi:hypothetical protein
MYILFTHVYVVQYFLRENHLPSLQELQTNDVCCESIYCTIYIQYSDNTIVFVNKHVFACLSSAFRNNDYVPPWTN